MQGNPLIHISWYPTSYLCLFACAVLALRSGTAEAVESAVFKRARPAEGTEPVAAAALEMSHWIIIHTHVVDSDFQGLSGDECNHKPA